MIIRISTDYISTKKSNDGYNHYFFLLGEHRGSYERSIEAWELVYSQKDKYQLPNGIQSERLKTPGEVKGIQKIVRENKDIFITFPRDEKLSQVILKRYIDLEVLPLSEIARRSLTQDCRDTLYTVSTPIDWGDFVLLGR